MRRKWNLGHRATNYTKWMSTAEPYVVCNFDSSVKKAIISNIRYIYIVPQRHFRIILSTKICFENCVHEGWMPVTYDDILVKDLGRSLHFSPTHESVQ